VAAVHGLGRDHYTGVLPGLILLGIGAGLALEVASRVGGVVGVQLGHLARSAFASGMDLGLTVGACVAAVGCLIALAALPSRDNRASRDGS
jgi:hypothetical protein